MSDSDRISPYQIHTISMRWEQRKDNLGDNQLLHFKILRTYVIRIEWQNGRRITELILGVKGLIQLCHYHPCLQHYNHRFFVRSLLVNASEPSLAKIIVLFFIWEWLQKKSIKNLCNRFHFPYIRGDKYKYTILWCLCMWHLRDKSDFLYTRQYL